MKTKEQIAKESFILDVNDIFTIEEFCEELDRGSINHYDGDGYFHDGEKETDISVWNKRLTWNDVKDYPYVCWYNK